MIKIVLLMLIYLITITCLAINLYMFIPGLMPSDLHNISIKSFIVFYSKLLAILFSILIILFRRNRFDLWMGWLLLLYSLFNLIWMISKID